MLIERYPQLEVIISTVKCQSQALDYQTTLLSANQRLDQNQKAGVVQGTTLG